MKTKLTEAIYNIYFNRVAIQSISHKIDKEKITLNYFDDSKAAIASIKLNVK